MARLNSGSSNIDLLRGDSPNKYRFALLKIFFIIFLIILGLVINLGGVPGVERLGFHFWITPGPFVEYIGTGKKRHNGRMWTALLRRLYMLFILYEALLTFAFNFRRLGQISRILCLYERRSIFLRRHGICCNGRGRDPKPASSHSQSMQASLHPRGSVLHLVRDGMYLLFLGSL